MRKLSQLHEIRKPLTGKERRGDDVFAGLAPQAALEILPAPLRQRRKIIPSMGQRPGNQGSTSFYLTPFSAARLSGILSE